MRRLLMISPVPSHPTLAGNSARILHLCRALGELGFETHFAHVEFQQGDEAAMRVHWGNRFHPIPWRSPFRKHRVGPVPIPDRWRSIFLKLGWAHMGVDHHLSPATLDVLKAAAARIQPSVVLAHYVFCSALLACAPPGAPKLLDTHDVFAGRAALYRGLGRPPEWFYTTRAEEERGLLRANRILAIQSEDRAFFTGLLAGRREVAEVGHLAPPASKALAAPGPHFGFFASANPLNVEAIRWFVAEVLPSLRLARPNATLRVYGGVAAEVGEAEGVARLGPVEDPAAPYRECAVMVNPMRLGTGLKIKSLEALAHGSALVGSGVALAGLADAAGQGAWRADSPAEWVDTLAALLANPGRVAEGQELALNYARRYHARQMASLAEVCRC